MNHYQGYGHPQGMLAGVMPGSIYQDLGSMATYWYDGSMWHQGAASSTSPFGWNPMTGGLGGGLPTGHGVFSSMSAVHSQHLMAQAQMGLLSAVPHPPPMPQFKRDPRVPDTMGWREWVWNSAEECLQSPVQLTLWREAHLKAETWDKKDVIRGVAGIHALLVPKHWKVMHELGMSPASGGPPHGFSVVGIVERYGKFVLGTEGWRAQQVVIRELVAPSTEIGLKMEQRYPDVIIHYMDEEGDESCTSEKLLKLVKGSRSLLSLLPSPAPSPQPPLSPSPNLLSPPSSPPASQTGFQRDTDRVLQRLGWARIAVCVFGGLWVLLMLARFFVH